jgi:BspA type Leucine rich repeat region (6 copies)
MRMTTKPGKNMESKNSIAKTANPNTVASRLRTICAVRLVPLLLLLTLPTVVQAQFNFTTNNDGSLNIANYTGSSANVIIPDTANGLPVTSIGTNAFYQLYSLTNVMIGTNITSIGEDAFSNCTNLTSVTIPDSVSILGDFAFAYCYGLTNVTIGNGVTNFSIVFYYCTSLTSVTFGTNLTNIGGVGFCQLLCPGQHHDPQQRHNHWKQCI